MQPPSQPSDEPLEAAEELLLDALSDENEAPVAALERLCAQAPQLATQLRARFSELSALSSTLRALGQAGGASPSPLQLIAGRFQPLAELGRGGMSIVFLAWDQKLRRKVALKCARAPDQVRRSSATQLERRRARLGNEAQVLAQLDHPGVVPVYDVVRDEAGEVYVAMLRVRGVDLREVYRRCWRGEREWSLARVVGVLQRVCEAIAFAHERGVLHRDLKPANVMVGSFGEAYVMDWGLARTGELAGGTRATEARRAGDESSQSVVVTDRDAADSGSSPLFTQEGDIVGTPSYMPPEQTGESLALDGRADVYAIGAMLYELLAHVPPYQSRTESSTPARLIEALRQGPPQPLAQQVPQAPVELIAIVERAMAREREHRYASVRELGEELRAFLEGRVVRAHRTGAWAELRKWVSRNRLAAAGVGLSVAAVLIASSLQFVHRRQLIAVNQQLERRDYQNSVALAAAALRNGEVREARRLLERARPEQRGWEWRYLFAELETSSFDLSGHDLRVCALDIATDGKRLVAGDRLGNLSVWELEQRRRVAHRQVTSDRMTALAFSPDERSVFAASARGELEQFDLERLELVRPAPTPFAALARGGGTDLLMQPDGELLVGALSNSVFGWRPGQENSARRFDEPLARMTFLTSQPASGLVAAGAEIGQAAVWDARVGRRVTNVGRSNSRIDGVALTADGRGLITGDWHGQLELWNVEDSELQRAIDRLPRAIYRMRMSPENDVLAVASGCSVHLYDTSTWEALGQLNGNQSTIANLVFSADGRWLAASDLGGSVHVWDQTARLRRLRSRAAEPLRDAIIDANSQRLVTVGDWGVVQVWDLATQAPLARFRIEATMRDVALAYGGGWLVTTDNSGVARVHDLENGELITTRSAPKVQYRQAEVLRSERALIAAHGDGRVERFEFDAPAPTWSTAPLGGESLTRMQLSADGRVLVLCGEGGQLATVDAHSGAEQRWQPFSERIAWAHPDSDGGSIVLRLHSGEIARFDVARGELVWVAPFAETGDCAWSHDGERVFATGNSGDLVVLDASSGEVLATLPGARVADKRVLASPDGGAVATVGIDNRVRIWRAPAPE